MESFKLQKMNRVPPHKAVFLALLSSLCVFLVLDLLEQLLLSKGVGINLRVWHLARGFIATFFGMALVWSVMERKERELTKWRDHFSNELEARTAQLQSTTDDRIEDASRLSAVLDSLEQGIIEITESGVIRRFNRTALKILESDDLTGEHINVITSSCSKFDSPICVSALDKQAGSLESYDLLKSGTGIELSYVCSSKSKKLLSWYASAIKSEDKNFGFVIAISDITEQKRLQFALLQQRDDFVAVIKHRLHINVVAVQRVVNLFMDKVFGALSDEQLRTVRVLSETVNDTQNVLNMLVDVYLYRNSQRVLKNSSVSIVSLVGSAVDSVKASQTAGKTIDIGELSEEIRIAGDRRELEIMLKHLLLNGLRYAAHKVEISFKTEAEFIHLSVADDGPGISEADIPHLFDRFFQESSEGKHVAVTGIGLCLCSEIVRAHKGRINCRSKAGSGTEFVVTLPRIADRSGILEIDTPRAGSVSA